MIKASTDVGMTEVGISIYKQMRQLGVEHDTFTLPIINQAFLMIRNDVIFAKMMHCAGIKVGFGSDVYFCNTLIEFYMKCGCICLARKVFDEMFQRDSVSWTSIISGYVSEGNSLQAFDLFGEMRRELKPNSVTMITVLQACSCYGGAVLGKQLHGFLVKKGFLNDKSVRNSLLRMYANMGSCEDVEILGCEICNSDVVGWNILMSFHHSLGDFVGVIELFSDMLCQVAPSVETLTVVASALAKSRNYPQGQQLHCFAVKTGFRDHILLTCLLDLYAKFGDLDASAKLFNEIPQHSALTWSALMSGFIEHGDLQKAIELFKQMQAEDHNLGEEIIGCLLDACAEMGSLQMGKEIHGHLMRNFPEISSFVETYILNMYIGCGSISSARRIFNLMAKKDLIAWTSMIEGLGIFGLGLEAIELFHQMLNKGTKPNSITFISILSACSHSGLTSEGCKIFHQMKWVFGIEPELRHYTCIVDLLGRSGKLKEALAITLKMLVCHDSRIWGALLAASRVYVDRKIGNYAAKSLMQLDPDNAGYQIVLSNMQASAEQWREVEELRRTATRMDMKKKPGWSCVETRGKIDGFVSGDRTHPEMEEIYEVLGLISRQMQDPDAFMLQQNDAFL